MYSAWGGTDTAGVCLLLCPRAEQSTTPAAPVHLGDGTLALKGEKKEAINAPAIDRTRTPCIYMPNFLKILLFSNEEL